MSPVLGPLVQQKLLLPLNFLTRKPHLFTLPFLLCGVFRQFALGIGAIVVGGGGGGGGGARTTGGLGRQVYIYLDKNIVMSLCGFGFCWQSPPLQLF